jgi:hypothetical protein
MSMKYIFLKVWLGGGVCSTAAPSLDAPLFEVDKVVLR